MRRPFDSGIARPRQRAESGQAMVEFALILFPLLLIVAGVIQFGIALNFWLDSNRLANQGARFAVVNAWPGCPRTQTSPATCSGTSVGANNSLQVYLKDQAISKGLEDAAEVCVRFPSGTSLVGASQTLGDPVTVRVESSFDLLPIFDIGSFRLRGEATMRLENVPTHLTADVYGVINPCP
jgi:TadE-like protein